MDNEQQVTSPTSASQHVTAPFTQAYSDYERALYTAWNTKNVAEQVANINHKFASQMQVQPPSIETQQRVSNAYQQWIASASAEGSIDQQRQALVDAYTTYLRALQEVASTASKSAQFKEESYRSYLQELREAASVAEIKREAEQALREFKLAVQKAWAQIDIQALDSEGMVLIGQVLQAAARLTATFAAQLHQQNMMTVPGLV
jgi:hypothetical protein